MLAFLQPSSCPFNVNDSGLNANMPFEGFRACIAFHLEMICEHSGNHADSDCDYGSLQTLIGVAQASMIPRHPMERCLQGARAGQDAHLG